jgi:two-component system chemotaxis sensor kinase CheA
MPSKQTLKEWRAQLSRSVETLAMQVVLEEEPYSSSKKASKRATSARRTLAEIRKQADKAGEPQVAEIASSMLGAMSSRSSTGCPVTEILNDGVLRLQQALERENCPSAQAVAESDPVEPGPRPACDSVSLAQDPELLGDFILESREHLATIEIQLLAIEQDPHNLEPIHAAFRGFHTIKGLAGFLELTAIQEVAHEVETILDLARNARLAITPPVIDVVLESADYLKIAIHQVEAVLQGKEPAAPAGNSSLIERIRRLLSDEPPSEPLVDSVTQESDTGADLRSSSALLPEAPEKTCGVAAGRPSESRAVKVDTAKLDHLVDMVGEMVIAQSLLHHDTDLAAVRSPRLQRNLSQLASIALDVQRTAMAMRMVPVGTLFQRMARLVRDLSRKAGKQVELSISGEETELDRNIVEELADPLMHMIRNAIDHGLEPPEDRVTAGKTPLGHIGLAAYHQSGIIVIQISDDGRGLDREKILRKARERGLIDGGSQLPDSDIFSLIFEPGFSTAAQITEVSGRGVGMDVVKKNITKMRGRVEIQSVLGKGATFLLKLPLTLAIIDGLVVKVGKERYIVPISTVHEMLRPAREALSTVQNRAEMVQVRGSLLPVMRLYRRFGVTPRSEDPTECLLIVAEAVGKRFCLMVDELIGKQEVVIKSLGDALKNIPGVAGGAILGDGRVGLILDMDGIFGAGADA